MSISPLQPGDRAPDFHLPDDRGQIVHLSDFAGKWLNLWWSPVALAKGCKSCGHKIVETLAPLHERSIEVVGVTLETVAENAEKATFVFESRLPILSSDWDTANEWRAARPLTSPWAMVPHPISYLVNPHGEIIQSWMVHHSGQDHILDIINSVPQAA